MTQSECYTIYYPYTSEICGFVQSLTKYTASILSSNETIYERHNAYVDFVISLLLFSTGHRAVVDPFCYVSDIDVNKGLCIIDDKVVSDAHKFRLVALAEIACEQINLYFDHLRKLSRIFYNRGGESRAIAYAIKKLLDQKGKQEIPLFFYLGESLTETKSVTSSTITECWKKHWNIKNNFGRKFLATELDQIGVPADLISVQLGHQGGIEHPFGLTSTYTPRTSLKYLAQQIDSIMIEAGWDVLPGFKAGGRTSSDSSRWRCKKYHGHQSKEFGPEERALNRENKKNQSRTLIRSVVNDTFPGGLPKQLTKEDLSLLFEQIRLKADIENCSLTQCLRLFHRWLSRLRYTGYVIPANCRIFNMDGEGPPFNRNILGRAKALDETRENFSKYLYEKGKKDCSYTLERRLAELTISAAIFGSISDKEILKRIYTTTISACYQLEEITFVDFLSEETKQSLLLYRWHLDSISLGLIIGLYRQYSAKVQRALDDHLYKQELKNLFSIIRPTSTLKGETIHILSILGHTALSLEKPGYIRSSLNGDIPYRALPLSAIARLVKNKRLKPVDGLAQESPDDLIVGWLPDMSVVGKNQDKDVCVRFKKDFRKVFNEVLSTDPKGYDRRRKQLKKKLVKEIKEFYKKEERLQSCGIVCAWAIWLCVNGTRALTNISYGTVSNYTFMIGIPLLEKAYDKDFFSMGEEEFEEFYLNVIRQSKHNDTEQLEHVIKEFHHFLIETWAIDDLDWSVLSASGIRKDKLSSIDANFISYSEYQSSLNIILNDKTQGAVQRYQHSALLIFGYRFGIRFDEAFNIQWRNIQHLSDFSLIFLILRNNVFRELKSKAGIRQIPLVGTLNELEKSILQKLIEHNADYFVHDPLTPLMAKGINSRDRIDRGYATQYINLVLKQVTGDKHIHFHHLRHSWSMRLGSICIPAENECSWHHMQQYIAPDLVENDAEILCGSKSIDRRFLKAISRSIGHAYESTTVSSYMHIIDCLAVNNFVDSNEGLPDYAAAYVLGIKSSTLRKKMSRLAQDERSFNTILNQELLNHIFPSPPIDLEERLESLGTYYAQSPAKEIAPITIERALRTIAHRYGNHAGIAESFFINEDMVEKIIHRAVIVEKQSGYDAYRAILAIPDPMYSLDTITGEYTSKYTEIVRTQKALDGFHLLSKNYSDIDRLVLRAGLESWIEAHQPRTGKMIFASIKSVKSYLAMLKILGFEETQHTAMAQTGSTIRPDAIDLLKQMDIPVIEIQRIPRNYEKIAIRKKFRISLKPIQLPDSVQTSGTLNRFCFILAVWLEIIVDRDIG